MRDIFIKKLTERAAVDPRIFLITGDLGFGVLTDFAAQFPQQFLNVGIAEQNMTGVATGLALEGRIVFTYSIANFPTLRCLEQIRNDACYHDANVKIVAIGGGFSYGSLGISHHATEDLSILRALPQMTVVSPGDDWEAGEAAKAIIETSGTCYLRLDKSSAGNTRMPGETFRLGKMRRLREGRAITLFATGGILAEVLKAADQLVKEGIECRVLSVHTIKPIDDDEICRAAMETGGIITVEEHTVEGGLGSIVAETCLESGARPRRFYRMGLRNTFSATVGTQEYLRQVYGLDAETIIACVKRNLE